MQEISRRREKPSLVGINVLGVGQEPFDFLRALSTSRAGIVPTLAWRARAEEKLLSRIARGSDGRRSRQSPLHRLNPLHVGCKKLASALASMDDKRMLHSFRALAPDLKQLRLADQPNDGLARAIAANEPPWRIDEAMNPLTRRKKTFGLVGRQSDVGVRHGSSP